MNQTFLSDLHLIVLYEWDHLVWALLFSACGKRSPRLQQTTGDDGALRFWECRGRRSHPSIAQNYAHPTSPAAANSNTSAAPCSSYCLLYARKSLTHTQTTASHWEAVVCEGLREAAAGWHLSSGIFMECNDAKMNSISSAWSHWPFRGDSWLLLAAVHLSRRASPSSMNPKENMKCVSPSAWECNAGVAYAAVKDPLCQCPGALCSLTLLSLLPPTLSGRCGLCALSDITAENRTKRVSGEI